MILKEIFYVDEWCSFGENNGKCKETQRYQTSNHWSKKELLSISTKLSYNTIFSKSLLAIEMRK